MSVRRLLLIVNPNSGRRRAHAVASAAREAFEAAQITVDVVQTTGVGHARQIARESDLSQYTGLVVAGGDGTLHEVVSGTLERTPTGSLPIGLIPAGSGNDVAQQLKLSSIDDAIRRIIDGATVEVDVARVSSDDDVYYSITLVGWAGVADINCRAERWRWMGPRRYSIAAAWQVLFPRPASAELKLGLQTLKGRFQLVVICNTIFAGAGMQMAPRASMSDGLLDVLVVRGASRWQLLKLFTQIDQGTHVDLPCVEYFQVESASISTIQPEPLDIDGEIRGTTPVSVVAIPNAIRMFGAPE